MDYKNYFTPYAAEQNKFLTSFFAKKKNEASQISPVAKSLWSNLEAFIKGGKRIRGGLVKLGYETFGGKNVKAIIPVSAAIELTHGAILVHDDIIDQDVLRHNRPTVHKIYEAYHKKYYKKGNPLHYGESMAICVGDTGFYEALTLIAESQFLPKQKLQVVLQLNKTMVNTCYGEVVDVDFGQREKISENEINLINTLKTAHYTIMGPLKIGGLLAGANRQRLKTFEKYGLPLGLAFQIQDDILGMFGDVKSFGKSTLSDIKEGKNTLLYAQAVKRATREQVKVLSKLWGKKDITQKETGKVKKIIKETGSLDYNRQLSLKLVAQAKKAVPKISKDKSLQEVYLTLADFIVEREK